MTSVTKTVLLTGATGYLGAYVLQELLKKGYRVRASVRNAKKAEELQQLVPGHKGQLEFAFVADITQRTAFDEAIKGVDYVIHCASPVALANVGDPQKELFTPAIEGTLSVLEAAAKEHTVKRVVITSSTAAVMDLAKDLKTHVITEKDWNPVTLEQALATTDAFVWYIYSKTAAEHAVWKFVEERKPAFEVVTLCPPFIFGPIAHHVEKLSDVTTSVGFIYAYLNGKATVDPVVGWAVVDVRDAAVAHVLALEKKEAANQRYYIGTSPGPFEWQDVLDIANTEFAGKTKAVKGEQGKRHPELWGNHDNSKSVKELGLVYRKKEDTFRDTVAQFVELTAQGK